MNIKGLINDYEEEDNNDENIKDDIDEENRDEFEDKLKKHFSSLYLTDKQLKNYDDAGNKIQLLDNIMMNENKSIFTFSSIYGLKIFNDRIVFSAPESSMDEYQWMFHACNIIDKILKYFNEDDDELFEEE